MSRIDEIQAYEQDLRDRSNANKQDPGGPSLTKQADAESADVNNIMRQYIQTGDVRLLGVNPGQYLDLTDVPDFLRCMNISRKAQEDFMLLPAEVRSEFDNDPAKMVEAIYDPAQKDRLTELGIFDKAENTTEPATPATPTPPAPATPTPNP